MNLKIEELFKNFNLEFDSMEKNKENLSDLKNKYWEVEQNIEC